MTPTAILAYLLIGCYFVIERSLRKGEIALSLRVGAADHHSSTAIWVSGLAGIFLVLMAPILNTHHLGAWNSPYVGWMGIFSMLVGLILRYWAARTLGVFYTRTLQTLTGQQIIDQPPYSVIRHPGYLGTFFIETGAGFAIMNWVVLASLVGIGMASRLYRIQVEEAMLQNAFGAEYNLYAEKTWRLIPFIY
jgi:protein-S-isoprenylcysteine O-methyltransferase Ste14